MRGKTLLPLLILLVSLIHAPRATAQDWVPVTDAEKSMKTNPLDPGSGAVVLFKRGELNVLEKESSNWRTNVHTYTRIKILTEAGRESANVSIDFPKYMRLSKIEGHTIKPSGEIVPLDTSQVFRGTIFSEGKQFAMLQERFTFPAVEPGAIIEYQTDEYVDGVYPPTYYFDTYELGTLASTLKVTVGPRLALAQFPLETTTNKIAVAKAQRAVGFETDYTAQNLRPIRNEPLSVPFRDQAAAVMFTPVEVAFSGQVFPIIKKWDDIADRVSDYVSMMNKNSSQMDKQAKELAAKLPDPKDRAQAIYTYIQKEITSNPVYGIGLGRPMDDILTAKHGDPDEINAMYVSMLKEVKVDANLVLIGAQNWQGSIIKSFPNLGQFSRIVTRVNLKDGSIFVDPSEAAAPFGELPWFEKGVTGVLVKGSKVEDTPVPAGAPEDNLSSTKTTFQVTKDWTATGDVEFSLKGAEAIDFRADMQHEPPEKIEQRLSDYFGYGNGDSQVTNIAHPEFKDPAQPIALKAHLKEKLTEDIGPGDLLLNPWLDDQYSTPLFKASERHSVVRFQNPEKRVSTSVWTLDPAITVQQLPKDVSISNDVGEFSHSCKAEGPTITCTRTFVLKKTNLKNMSEYNDTRLFFDQIAKNDKEVMVLHGN
jgi:hypothetical protein